MLRGGWGRGWLPELVLVCEQASVHAPVHQLASSGGGEKCEAVVPAGQRHTALRVETCGLVGFAEPGRAVFTYLQQHVLHAGKQCTHLLQSLMAARPAPSAVPAVLPAPALEGLAGATRCCQPLPWLAGAPGREGGHATITG